jgi:hypothetical protein
LVAELGDEALGAVGAVVPPGARVDERLVACEPGLEVVLEAGGAEVQGAGGGVNMEAGFVNRSGLRGEEAAFAGLLAVGVAEVVAVARTLLGLVAVDAGILACHDGDLSVRSPPTPPAGFCGS